MNKGKWVEERHRNEETLPRIRDQIQRSGGNNDLIEE